MSDDDYLCFGGASTEGWSLEVWLHRGQPTGEIRFALDGAPKFIVPIGIEEVALVRAAADGVPTAAWTLEQCLDRVIREHRPH